MIGRGSCDERREKIKIPFCQVSHHVLSTRVPIQYGLLAISSHLARRTTEHRIQSNKLKQYCSPNNFLDQDRTNHAIAIRHNSCR